jgi:predicted metalloprotease with PDZ domain
MLRKRSGKRVAGYGEFVNEWAVFKSWPSQSRSRIQLLWVDSCQCDLKRRCLRWYCRHQDPSLLVAGALWCLTLDSASGQQKTLAITTSSSAQEHTLRRGDTVQCIDRIFSSASNVQQQEATHNAEIFVKAIHAGDLIRTCYCPIAVPDKRGSQRVKKHK